MEVKNALPLKSASCSIYPVSVTDENALKDIAAMVGTWDILVLSTGFVSNPSSAIESLWRIGGEALRYGS
jgi:hypothetical protein